MTQLMREERVNSYPLRQGSRKRTGGTSTVYCMYACMLTLHIHANGQKRMAARRGEGGGR